MKWEREVSLLNNDYNCKNKKKTNKIYFKIRVYFLLFKLCQYDFKLNILNSFLIYVYNIYKFFIIIF